MSYQSVVLGDSPSGYWPLTQTSGNFVDAGANSLPFGGVGASLARQSYTTPMRGATSVPLFISGSGATMYCDLLASSYTTYCYPEYNTAFSVECWFSIIPGYAAVNASSTILSRALNGSPYTGWAVDFYSSTDMLRWYIYNNASTVIYVQHTGLSNIYQQGFFNHVVATYDGTGSAAGMNLYFNGQQRTPTNTSGATAISSGTIRGAYPFSVCSRDTAHNNMGNLLVSDVAFYPAALTATQVWNHYAAGAYGGAARNLGTDLATGHAIPMPGLKSCGAGYADGHASVQRPLHDCISKTGAGGASGGMRISRVNKGTN